MNSFAAALVLAFGCMAWAAPPGWTLDCQPADVPFDFTSTSAGNARIGGQNYARAGLDTYIAFLDGGGRSATFAPSAATHYIECRAKYAGKPPKDEPELPIPTRTLGLEDVTVFGPVNGLDASRLQFVVEVITKHPHVFSQSRSLVTTPRSVVDYQGEAVALLDLRDRDVTFRIYYLLVVEISDSFQLGSSAVQNYFLGYRLEPDLYLP